MEGMMVSSPAKTVEEYLAALSPKDKEVIPVVRRVILENLPSGYEEAMNWGMISYEVPLSRYPKTYNKKPLMYAALAVQKHHYALYLTSLYQNEELLTQIKAAFAEVEKKLDMGKSCLRFTQLEQLPLDVIGRLIADTPVEEFLKQYEKSRQRG